MTKVLLSVVGLILGLMIIAGPMPDVIDDVAADDYSEPFTVVTGANVTSANATLSYAHYYEDLTDLSATSNYGSDVPVVLAYDEDDYIVTVGGLIASQSRILTINYVRESRQQFTGFSAFIRLLPFLLVIGLVVACLWGLFSAWKSSRG